jgi:hypothetical protein
MSDEEFSGALTSVERHLDNPDTLVVWPYFQAWGRKP